MKSDYFDEGCENAARPEFTPGERLGLSWFSIQKRNAVTSINFFAEIGCGLSSENLLSAVADAAEIELQINSPGGDCVAAFKLLDGFNRRVSLATIYGNCFSAAVLLALSAKKIRMASNASLMIHPATIFVLGNESELRWRADGLAKINARIKELLTLRTARGDELLSGKDFYFTAAEALAAGLVDEIYTQPEIEHLPPASFTPAAKSAPTDEEILFQQFLRAFGEIKVTNRNQFVHGITAWAIHHSIEITDNKNYV